MHLDINPCRRVYQSNKSWYPRAAKITRLTEVFKSNTIIPLDNYDLSLLEMKNSIPGWVCTDFIHMHNSKITLSRISQISSDWHCRTYSIFSSRWSNLGQLEFTRCLNWTINLIVEVLSLIHLVIKMLKSNILSFIANLNALQCTYSVSSTSFTNLPEYPETRFEYNILPYHISCTWKWQGSYHMKGTYSHYNRGKNNIPSTPNILISNILIKRVYPTAQFLQHSKMSIKFILMNQYVLFDKGELRFLRQVSNDKYHINILWRVTNIPVLYINSIHYRLTTIQRFQHIISIKKIKLWKIGNNTQLTTKPAPIDI